MEAEVVEDKRKATPCECGHPAGVHALDGVGHCTAAGCACKGPAVMDDEVAASDGSRHGVPVVRFGRRALKGASLAHSAYVSGGFTTTGCECRGPSG